MEVVYVDPSQTPHHGKLVLLLIHSVIMLWEREAVGDLQAVFNHQPKQRSLGHLHVAAWFFMAVLQNFHYRLQKNQNRLKLKVGIQSNWMMYPCSADAIFIKEIIVIYLGITK